MNYLETHIAYLKQDNNSKSSVFIDYGLGFQFQALEGEISSDNQGYFSIILMLNLGQIAKGYPRTYIGGESVVTIGNIHNFISYLNSILIDIKKI